MYYKLTDNISLRSWKFIPRAYYLKNDGFAKGLSKEEFDLLLLCDGEHDIPESELTKDFELRGFIEKCSRGDFPCEWSRHKSYEHRYFPKMNFMITGKCNYNCLHCFNASDDGSVVIAEEDMGVPFASVCNFAGSRNFDIGEISCIEDLKTLLTIKIEEQFGLNSMHVVRIDGQFDEVQARSEEAYHAIHVSLKDMLQVTQKSFQFNDICGTLVGVYYPDFMDGINAAGWHIHFVSDDRLKGGHVFELKMKCGHARLDKISTIEIQLPTDSVFDTHSIPLVSCN